MGKFGQKPMKQPGPLPPKDPSAMSVLGMTPPERPPPTIPTNQTLNGSMSTSSQPSDAIDRAKVRAEGDVTDR